jgi:chromatin remodeling complex protein RSC6
MSNMEEQIVNDSTVVNVDTETHVTIDSSAKDNKSQKNKNQREECFEDITTSIFSLKTEVSGLYTKLKLLEKAVNKEVKVLNKAISRNKQKGNRKPSGFAKSSKISESLCLFMDKPVGSEVARTEVTKYIINYIKEQNLQRPENKKFINSNEQLKALLQVPEGDDLSYFNLQKYMNKHFL